MSDLSDKISEMIDDRISELMVVKGEPYCDYSPSKNAFYVSTTEESDYDGYVEFDYVIDLFISDRVAGNEKYITGDDACEAVLFIKRLREAADLIESKVETGKGEE